MTNMHINFRSTLQTGPSAELHMGVAEMNASSVGGPRYFITCIDEACGHFIACHVRTKGVADESLRQHVL